MGLRMELLPKTPARILSLSSCAALPRFERSVPPPVRPWDLAGRVCLVRRGRGWICGGRRGRSHRTYGRGNGGWPGWARRQSGPATRGRGRRGRSRVRPAGPPIDASAGSSTRSWATSFPRTAKFITSSRIFATASGASANWSNFSKKVSRFISRTRRWRFSESQRDSGVQPGVAAQSLPWDCSHPLANPERVASTVRRMMQRRWEIAEHTRRAVATHSGLNRFVCNPNPRVVAA